MPSTSGQTPDMPISAVVERIATRIEAAKALDPGAAALAAFLRPIMPKGKARDMLSGTPIGHPLHPLLVTVPIGSWLGASWVDFTTGPSGRKAASRLVGLGILAAGPTALAGASDWLDTMEGERRVGFVHALGNDVALGLYIASWLSRRRGRHARGKALALAGAGMLGVSGWLGGHLSYALGVGVDTTAFQTAPSDWTDVALLDDLPEGRPTARPLGETPVLLLRRGSHVTAINDRCSHRGGPLHEGELADGCITCPWHGSQFRLDGGESDGVVVSGPATRPQERFETRIVGGHVEARRIGTDRSLGNNPVAVDGLP
jgi:nitrite reductase/ring-hydroxylating ferredoxin subunit/uncharacterized membrane protein